MSDAEDERDLRSQITAKAVRIIVKLLWVWILLLLLFGISYFVFSGDFSVLPAIYRTPAGG